MGKNRHIEKTKRIEKMHSDTLKKNKSWTDRLNHIREYINRRTDTGDGWEWGHGRVMVQNGWEMGE